MDYIFPDFVAKALRKPSMRTQMEASLIGIVFIMLASIISSGYVVFFSDMGLFWKIMTGVGEIGILTFMISNLMTVYLQYYTFKTAMNMYSEQPTELTELKNECQDLNKEETSDILTKSNEEETKC